ncbi:MAG: YceI family protein [Spirochaetia bacterium]|nr:YceI family protein [Spirochaetia bacterium]
MKLIQIGAMALAGMGFVSSAFAGELTLDKSHTKVEFTVTHLTISEVTGRFDDFSAKGTFDEKTSALTGLQVNIKVESVNTNDADRDKHLKSADFFDAGKFPEITFKQTKPTVLRKGVPTPVMGELTMRGVTKPVTLVLVYKGTVKDPWGNTKAGFAATTKVNRKDYGVSWNKTMDTGGAVVSDEVSISIAGEVAIK